jgi:polyphosphate kinase
MKSKDRKKHARAAVATRDVDENGERGDAKRAKHTADIASGTTKVGGNGDLGPLANKNTSAESKDGRKDGKLSRKKYEKELLHLQTEVCKLQEWVKETGQRIVIVFEGRDAAGKGGMIRALTARVSPRVFRVVALPAPSDRQKTQVYVQRYMQHFPAAGEVVIFDRSWYNRAGVERVMGFVSKQGYERFLTMCPEFEKMLLDNGITLVKYWLEVSDEVQKRRFEARIADPMRQWKLSPMDLPSRERWYEYSRARDAMLDATDTDLSPWHIVRSDNKRRAHLNVLSHFLSVIPYKAVKRPKVKLPQRSKKHAYDDETPIRGRKWIPELPL